LDFYDTIFEVIDMRSFSNLWFWIALAVLWSSVSHWVLGVPYDMIMRARRQGGEAMQDLEDLTRVSVKRMVMIADVAGILLTLFISAVMTTLLLMAFVYDVEFAQAIVLLLLPLTLLGGLSIRAARQIQEGQLRGAALVKRLLRHRFATQLIGVIAIFVTAMFGMYQNLSVAFPGY
jgi:hypothetical protein